METLVHINHLSYVFSWALMWGVWPGWAGGPGDLMTAPQNEILKEYVFLEKSLSCNTPRVLSKRR